MKLLWHILIGIIAFLHMYILWFEMFSWKTTGRKIFKKYPAEFFNQTGTLASNQGLYNGFLAVGLFWSLVISDPAWKINVAVFFLSCVATAGLYGALTADKKIFFVQALPAIATLVLTLLIR
ncbi:MAG TPA: DUF1304 domain-containing protein [Flavobacteriales bacterium]|nr:DUF1304 domain-containing protein [Flavobacteriales bacterium]